jgi:hypothetical protein
VCFYGASFCLRVVQLFIFSIEKNKVLLCVDTKGVTEKHTEGKESVGE